MNRSMTTITAVMIAGGVLLAGCSSTASSTSGSAKLSAAIAAASASPGATPSSSAALLLPVKADPIVNPSTSPVLQITQALAENNVDPATGTAIGDRLQLTLHNSGATALTGFEVYYTMTDVVTKATERYYQRLDGLSIPAGATTTVFFDGKSGAGHYAENQFSIYRSSRNQVDFAIEVSAKGAKLATATAVKSKGTAEKVD